MNTTFRLSTVALAAALCWQTSAHATATEAQLRSVTLYGNVSIQEDSTSSWGPWAEFEPPAAGNTQPVAAPRAATDPYRPLAQTTTNTTPPVTQPVTPPCASGGLCGFGMFVVGDPNDFEDRPERTDVQAFRLNGNIVQAAQSEGEGSSALLPQVIGLNATVLSNTNVPFQLSTSGDLTYTNGTSPYLGETPGNFYYGNNGVYAIGQDPQKAGNGYSPEQITATHFKLVTYVKGPQGSVQGSWGVIGYTTPAADMEALRGSAQANYNGSDHYGNAVAMTVNFNGGANGQGSWSGTWNGGSDGTVSTQASTNGTILTGQVGFTAAGNIQGSTFTSTSVGTNDARGSVTGFVQGAFFGPNAAAAGGVVDITKTMQPSPQQQPAAVQVSPGQGYTGRYVAPFIATRNNGS